MTEQSLSRTYLRCAPLAVLLCATALPALAATRSVDQHQSADPAGTVEIVNVSGAVEVVGWEQPVVAVSGTIGERVERVEVTGSGARVTVRVVLPKGNFHHDEGDARLRVQVPRRSALEVSLVSADLRVGGVSGDQHLQTVSGDISGEAGGNLQVNTVSGDVHLEAHDATSIRIKTVSGDATLSGGTGDINVESVSGDAHLMLGVMRQAHFESVSGDLNIVGALDAGGQLEASTVSGDVNVSFSAAPDADIDVQSFSGDISNCVGPKAVEQQYGPGSRLSFRSGKGGGHVHIDTKSGDVGLCTKK
jgi:hypothetical protein